MDGEEAQAGLPDRDVMDGEAQARLEVVADGEGAAFKLARANRARDRMRADVMVGWGAVGSRDGNVPMCFLTLAWRGE